jgi:hypothetical protein
MTTIAHHTSFATANPAHDRAPVAPAVGHALVTAGKFVGNFAVALTLAVLLGADADL